MAKAGIGGLPTSHILTVSYFSYKNHNMKAVAVGRSFVLILCLTYQLFCCFACKNYISKVATVGKCFML